MISAFAPKDPTLALNNEIVIKSSFEEIIKSRLDLTKIEKIIELIYRLFYTNLKIQDHADRAELELATAKVKSGKGTAMQRERLVLPTYSTEIEH